MLPLILGSAYISGDFGSPNVFTNSRSSGSVGTGGFALRTTRSDAQMTVGALFFYLGFSDCTF